MVEVIRSWLKKFLIRLQSLDLIKAIEILWSLWPLHLIVVSAALIVVATKLYLVSPVWSIKLDLHPVYGSEVRDHLRIMQAPNYPEQQYSMLLSIWSEDEIQSKYRTLIIPFGIDAFKRRLEVDDKFLSSKGVSRLSIVQKPQTNNRPTPLYIRVTFEHQIFDSIGTEVKMITAKLNAATSKELKGLANDNAWAANKNYVGKLHSQLDTAEKVISQMQADIQIRNHFRCIEEQQGNLESTCPNVSDLIDKIQSQRKLLSQAVSQKKLDIDALPVDPPVIDEDIKFFIFDPDDIMVTQIKPNFFKNMIFTFLVALVGSCLVGLGYVLVKRKPVV